MQNRALLLIRITFVARNVGQLYASRLLNAEAGELEKTSLAAATVTPGSRAPDVLITPVIDACAITAEGTKTNAATTIATLDKTVIDLLSLGPTPLSAKQSRPVPEPILPLGTLKSVLLTRAAEIYRRANDGWKYMFSLD